MQGLGRLCSIVAALSLAVTTTLWAETLWSPVQGQSTLSVDRTRMLESGLTISIDGRATEDGSTVVIPVSNATRAFTTPMAGGVASLKSVAISHEGRLLITLAGRTVELGHLNVSSGLASSASMETTSEGLLEFPGSRAAWDAQTQTLKFRADDVRMSNRLANDLGHPELAGVRIGSLSTVMTLAPAGTDSMDEFAEPVDVILDKPSDGDWDADADGAPRGGPTWSCGGRPGPDVIVGDLVGNSGNSAFQVTAVNVGTTQNPDWVDAFSVGTTSCNIGTTPLSWVDEGGSNAHPVIGQNFFRLSNGRFEQIGQAWLKHGFFALQGNVCCSNCAPQNGDIALGVGCSDPYSASRNAGQAGHGPKWQVNPTTGVHIHPVVNPSFSGNVARRLQVHLNDLTDAGALYFVEGQYVTADDAANGNQNNNASYRQVLVTGTGNDRTFTLTGTTQRAQCGIRAWRDNDPTVTETEIQVPSDGLYIVGSKATDLGGGKYHYEFAVQNLNSNRGSSAFTVPITAGAVVENIGFHDVDYHSSDGEGNVARDGTDWTGAHVGNTVTWTMTDVGVNSNALRWGTLYNFRFDANVLPSSVNAALTLYAAGSPATGDGTVVGPGGQLILLDCNNNGIQDNLDIAENRSSDCNANAIPDECEPICDLTTVRVATGDQPSFVGAPTGDTTRLFITELTGRVRILNLTNGTVLATPFLDLTSLVRVGGEDGLFSIAFHPDYATNGKFYVNYTTLANPRRTRISQFTVSGNPNIADAASEVVLREITQPFSNHNAGQLQFGPDGMLYCAMGDGGSQGDPNNQSQNNASLLGKMLRLDVDNAPTYVPSDNPGGSFLPEVWAKGFRNPWRFSFDRLTGDLYIGDVGQDTWEEIDFQPGSSNGGENYGWRCYEGNAVYNSTGCGASSNYVFPIKVVNHSDSGTRSITGGYVYRGGAIPGLSGTYFYADYSGNWIRTFRYNGTTVSDEQDRTAELQPENGIIQGIVSFGEDASGELYIVSVTGGIYKIICVPTTSCGDGVVGAGEECDPPDGLNCDCMCQFVDNCIPVFEDNFQTNMGWTASSITAAAGFWERGVPVACTSRGAPGSDYDGSGQCYLTANNTGTGGDCNSDVDGTNASTPGSVILTSPVFDFSGGGQIRYAYWLMDTTGGEFGPGDGLTVEVSSDGGTNWTLARSYDEALAQWRTDTIVIGSGGVAPASATMRVRFIATDAAPGDVVEAGIDAFRACGLGNYTDCNLNCISDADDIANLTSFDCNNNAIPDECEEGVTPCDCNSNGINDAIDISSMTSADCNGNSIPDECDIVANPDLDCDGGPVGVAAAGQVLFDSICIACHNTNGTGGSGVPCGGPCPGPSLRNKTRVQLWNKLLPPTTHPGGAHPEYDQQDFADIEAFLADGGSKGRPDKVLDTCQTLADCDQDGATDGCELRAGTQVDADYDGIPDDCASPCGAADGDMNADTVLDARDLDGFVSGILGTASPEDICHGDFSGNAALDVADVDGMVAALLAVP